jgi:hypothetical protein
MHAAHQPVRGRDRARTRRWCAPPCRVREQLRANPTAAAAALAVSPFVPAIERAACGMQWPAPSRKTGLKGNLEMKKLTIALAALVAVATTPALAEEQQPARKFQVSPSVGAFIATGDQRDILDDAVLTGLTLSYDVHPNVAVVGSFAWALSKSVALGVEDDLDLFQYDVGVQGQYPFSLGQKLTLKPFLGAGVGARTYSFRDLDVDSETDFAGYFSGGANLEYGNLAFGVTVRDYVTAFDGIAVDADSATRNDLSVFGSVGLRF